MEYNDWDGWSDWVQLSVLKMEDIPYSAGVYIIAAEGALQRVFGIDENGILDIGESNNLNHRIGSFIGCVKGERQRGHIAGWRYFHFDFNRIFPFESLSICWVKCRDKDSAYALEGKLIQEYMRQHYELPPLNYKYNWS